MFIEISWDIDNINGTNIYSYEYYALGKFSFYNNIP